MFVEEILRKNEQIIRNYIKNHYKIDIDFKIEKATIEGWDYFTNIAFKLAKMLKKNPLDIGAELEQLSYYRMEKVTFVKPGFLNFKVDLDVLKDNINNFSFAINKKNSEKINIEFISANPTGPLNVVSGRAASFGQALASIFSYEGYEVVKEYYINDAGNQINIFANSLYKVYKEIVKKEKVEFLEDEYHGAYLYDMIKNGIADDIKKIEVINIKNEKEITDLFNKLLEKYNFDNLDLLKKRLLKNIKECSNIECVIIEYLKIVGSNIIIKENKSLLHEFGLDFDIWFSEKSLYEDNYPQRVLSHLKKKNLLYEKDGALFVKNSQLGDSQDWVLRKRTGEYTYFFGDIMYHLNKFDRGFKKAINIWGPDHQGSAKRLKIILENGFNLPKDFLEIIILQQVNLIKDGKKLKFSKRLGNFITLKEVLDFSGNDVARFYFLSKGYKQHIDFSLDALKQENEKSIIYYLQYMFARINGVLRKANIKSFEQSKLEQLYQEERDIALKMFNLPLTIKEAFENREPSTIIYYLNDLAKDFHKFYEQNKIIGSEKEKNYITFINILGQFVKKSLNFLGFNAPERM